MDKIYKTQVEGKELLGIGDSSFIIFYSKEYLYQEFTFRSLEDLYLSDELAFEELGFPSSNLDWAVYRDLMIDMPGPETFPQSKYIEWLREFRELEIDLQDRDEDEQGELWRNFYAQNVNKIKHLVKIRPE